MESDSGSDSGSSDDGTLAHVEASPAAKVARSTKDYTSLLRRSFHAYAAADQSVAEEDAAEDEPPALSEEDEAEEKAPAAGEEPPTGTPTKKMVRRLTATLQDLNTSLQNLSSSSRNVQMTTDEMDESKLTKWTTKFLENNGKVLDNVNQPDSRRSGSPPAGSGEGRRAPAKLPLGDHNSSASRSRAPERSLFSRSPPKRGKTTLRLKSKAASPPQGRPKSMPPQARPKPLAEEGPGELPAAAPRAAQEDTRKAVERPVARRSGQINSALAASGVAASAPAPAIQLYHKDKNIENRDRRAAQFNSSMIATLQEFEVLKPKVYRKSKKPKSKLSKGGWGMDPKLRPKDAEPPAPEVEASDPTSGGRNPRQVEQRSFGVQVGLPSGDRPGSSRSGFARDRHAHLAGEAQAWGGSPESSAASLANYVAVNELSRPATPPVLAPSSSKPSAAMAGAPFPPSKATPILRQHHSAAPTAAEEAEVVVANFVVSHRAAKARLHPNRNWSTRASAPATPAPASPPRVASATNGANWRRHRAEGLAQPPPQYLAAAKQMSSSEIVADASPFDGTRGAAIAPASAPPPPLTLPPPPPLLASSSSSTALSRPGTPSLLATPAAGHSSSVLVTPAPERSVAFTVQPSEEGPRGEASREGPRGEAMRAREEEHIWHSPSAPFVEQTAGWEARASAKAAKQWVMPSRAQVAAERPAQLTPHCIPYDLPEECLLIQKHLPPAQRKPSVPRAPPPAPLPRGGSAPKPALPGWSGHTGLPSTFSRYAAAPPKPAPPPPPPYQPPPVYLKKKIPPPPPSPSPSVAGGSPGPWSTASPAESPRRSRSPPVPPPRRPPAAPPPPAPARRRSVKKSPKKKKRKSKFAYDSDDDIELEYDASLEDVPVWQMARRPTINDLHPADDEDDDEVEKILRRANDGYRMSIANIRKMTQYGDEEWDPDLIFQVNNTEPKQEPVEVEERAWMRESDEFHALVSM